MKLLTTSFLVSSFALVAACGSPDVKLGNGQPVTGTGGASAGTGGEAGTPNIGGSGGEPSSCTSEVVGTSGVCSSLEELKAQAEAVCTKLGQTVAGVGFDGACDPGSAMFAKVTCCSDAPQPPPPPPPECIYDVAGDPAKCSSNDELKQLVADKCSAGGLAVVEIGFDNACGPDASYFAKFACCSGGEPPPPPPPCFGELIGDPVACNANELLAQKAYYVCNSAGAALTSLSFGDACDENSSHYAKVECCFPPPPPPPGECFGDWLGDPNGCTADELLKAKADAVCESQGATVSEIGFDDACGPGVSHTAKFICCAGPTPPPPPPPICDPQGVAADQCVDNDVLAGQAKELCASKGATVEGIAFDYACSPTSSQSAKFVCCAQEPPPPPPVSCWSAGAGSTECASNESLKQMASEQCAAGGAELASISYDNACGPDSSSSMKFECCSPML